MKPAKSDVLLAARVGLVLLAATLSQSVKGQAIGTPGNLARPAARYGGDNRQHPLGAKQFKNRQEALQDRIAGRGNGKVQRVANGQYVELQREGTDRVFVILAEFGNQTDPVAGGAPGPLHNQIQQPNRTLDNATIWSPDFDRNYFDNLYFSPAPGASSLLNYYQEQSSGRYAVEGAVVDWVRVPFNAAHYGNNLCGGTDCEVWDLVRDAINVWTANQLAAGMTPAEVKAYLDQFDVWDRYDYDGDGNFNEPDGYIDHFQIIHAGVGEESGGGPQGEDAIGSHRWYVDFAGAGINGPAFNQQGGAQFGTTGMWMGDYTIQPENGGLGVLAHEYAHDLGLPEEYDFYSGRESPAAFWTVMSRGDFLGPGVEDVGARPGDFDAWDKLQLGWLNFEVAFPGQFSTHKLGPAEFNTKQAQALVVVLPKKERPITLTEPYSGSFAWWSGMGDNLDNSMTRAVSLPAGPASLSMQVWYDTEETYDFAYVAVSNDNGATWANLATNHSTSENSSGQNFGNGITGSSGGWVPLTADLSPYAGQTILLRLRYWTDPYVQGHGLLADDITVTAGATTVFSDGAEAGDNGWTLAGFSRTTGVVNPLYNHYYIAEYRQHTGYDQVLRTGPYPILSFFPSQPDMVEHYPYQAGMLVSYWDTSMTDNGTALHPGEGMILPIDARPVPLVRSDGRRWAPGVQVYDAPFSLTPSDSITLHFNGVPNTYPSLPAVPVFDDRHEFWFADRADSGVKVPHVGVRIEVVSQSAHDGFMQVQVR